MKSRLLYILGVFFGLLPIYSIVSWWRHWYLIPKMDQLKRVEIYREDFLFGFSGEMYKFGLIAILFGAISITCFGVLLNRTGQIKDKSKALKSKIVRLSLLIIVSIFTYFNIWSLM